VAVDADRGLRKNSMSSGAVPVEPGTRRFLRWKAKDASVAGPPRLSAPSTVSARKVPATRLAVILCSTPARASYRGQGGFQTMLEP